jgi:cytochrome c oxidase assembly factor CtaG
MMEAIPVLNFCIAVSLLYLFYIPPSNGPWSDDICTLFSSLFHLSFLLAAFSCFSLVLLRPLRQYSRAKLAYAITLIFNWGELAWHKFMSLAFFL